MKKSIFFFFIILCTLTILLSNYESEPLPDIYPWLENLEEACHMANVENKPLLIIFRCVP